LIAPTDALAGLKRRFNLRLIFNERDRKVERALQIDRLLLLLATTIACSGVRVNAPQTGS
jgi:hypothetical protein